MIEILRLSHRIGRDPRISTHVALTSRTFGATKIYYSGDKDRELEDSVNKIVSKFGGPFSIEYVKDPLKLIKEKKENSFKVYHLTMYGLDFKEVKLNSKSLIIVGSEKVETEFYQLADYNVSVGNQPHSEVAAIGVFLYKNLGVKKKFTGSKIKIEPSAKGKIIKNLP